jgi:hypothetical protein
MQKPISTFIPGDAIPVLGLTSGVSKARFQNIVDMPEG